MDLGKYRNTLVCTVGASFLSNASKLNAPEEPKKILEFAKLGKFDEVARIVRKIEDPRNYIWGAEINSVASLVEKGFLSARQKMYLLVSDTPEGSLVGNILKIYFENNTNGLDFNSVEIVKIDKLDNRNRLEFKFQGLRNLVREMARCVKNHLEYSIINATGGYKATIAYATLLGQALNVPVYYLFETFDEIIELLPIPVKFDPNVYKNYSSIFAYLEYINTTDEESFLKKFGFRNWGAVPNELKIFIERVNLDNKNCLSLNPLGEIYLQTIEWDCSTIEDKDYMCEEDFSNKIITDIRHGTKFKEHNKNIIEEIAKLPWVKTVRITGTSEKESGDSYDIWIEADHLKIILKSKKGMGFLTVHTVIGRNRFLECVKEKIEKILKERR
ncbi:putative CRISPR-associated protein [Pseudothermotoga sp.]|nr:putative CRISPR-associated protein [Pseudothermotoga sp.]MCX7812488.1 putative CRISPR-associated protein [Pseudothermotoga sp.]MDW8140056.1 putative CRISPR-associated protein [Pseudothermotoga sp.]